MKLNVNGTDRDLPDTWADETLLAVLREQLGLVGAKFGCGNGECGSCVVHIDGHAQRSCLFSARDAIEREVVTIEGLAGPDGKPHPVQQAWIEERVAQCGYCQAGQIMQAAALLAVNPDPPAESAASWMSGNLCRCGTYARVRRGIRRAADLARADRGGPG